MNVKHAESDQTWTKVIGDEQESSDVTRKGAGD
jgi:hypothetical protein